MTTQFQLFFSERIRKYHCIDVALVHVRCFLSANLSFHLTWSSDFLSQFSLNAIFLPNQRLFRLWLFSTTAPSDGLPVSVTYNNLPKISLRLPDIPLIAMHANPVYHRGNYIKTYWFCVTHARICVIINTNAIGNLPSARQIFRTVTPMCAYHIK